MKYEYLCGYESDFFAMPANVIAVVRLDHCVQGLTEFNQIIECGKPVLAMRRIIAEPKSWTADDQKAGRLPEVDCVVTTYDGKPYVFVGESFSNDQWSLRDCETGKVCHTPISWVLPIESPKEKSQREENEFVKSEMKNTTLSMEWSCVYERGLRAAYRKLKGGE